MSATNTLAGRKAVITADHSPTVKVSRIGEEVIILRLAVKSKLWIRTPDGKEMAWRISSLKLLN
jgi:hypothetical protein